MKILNNCRRKYGLNASFETILTVALLLGKRGAGFYSTPENCFLDIASKEGTYLEVKLFQLRRNHLTSFSTSKGEKMERYFYVHVHSTYACFSDNASRREVHVRSPTSFKGQSFLRSRSRGLAKIFSRGVGLQEPENLRRRGCSHRNNVILYDTSFSLLILN